MHKLLIIPLILLSFETLGQKLWYENHFDNIPNDTLLTLGNEENNIWQIGSTEKSFFYGEGRMEPPSIMTDTIYPYPINARSSFEISFGTTFIELYHGFLIQFDHKYQTEYGRDGGFVEISYDNGNSWVNIIEDTLISKYGNETYITNFYSTNDTLFDGTPAFSGQSDEWKRSGLGWIWDEYYYPWISDREFTPRIRFVFQSDSIEDNYAGWIIDYIILSYGRAESVTEFSNSFQSQVFPNPVTRTSSLILDNTGNNLLILEIFNSSGKLINSLNIKSCKYEIHTSDYESGIYIYRLVNHEKLLYSTGKFIIR